LIIVTAQGLAYQCVVFIPQSIPAVEAAAYVLLQAQGRIAAH